MRISAFILVLLSLFSLVLSIFSIPLVSAVEDYWTILKPMPTARSGLEVAVVNDRIYAIGGNAYGIALNNNNEYDPITDTWALKMKMPTARAFFGIAVWQNKIYCIGGRKYDGLTGVNEVYDPATDTWENKSSMPTPRFSVVANVVGGKIYVIGGASGVKSNPTNLNEVYDPATDTWETKTPIPDPKSAYNSTVVDNKIYVIGDLTQIYDPETNSWSLGEPPPTPINGAVCATTGLLAPKRIYLLGGNLPQGNTTNLNQIYNPEDNTWTVGTPMTYDRAGLAIANVNDTLYALGGSHLKWYNTPVSPQDVAFNEHYVPLGYIPEFPSWTVLPLAMIMIIILVVLRRGARVTNSCLKPMANKRFIAALTIKKIMKTFFVSLLITTIISSSATVHAFEVTNTITLEKPGGYYGIAYDSGKNEIFLTNADFDLVSVISDSTNAVVANIPVESQPFAVVYDSGKGEIFVTNYNSSSVSVISDISHNVIANIPVGNKPCDLAYDSDKGEIFVGHAGCKQVLVISDSTNTVIADVSLENQPQGICYDSEKGEIFVTYSESNRISVISNSSLRTRIENWVEVARFEGESSMQTELFEIDCPEWRIRWEFDPGHFHFFPELHSFSVTTYPKDEYIDPVDLIDKMGNERSGTSYIHTNGSFLMRIKTGDIDSYTIIVEQNLDSIPEFPSWTPLLIMFVAVMTVALSYKQRLQKQNQRSEIQ